MRIKKKKQFTLELVYEKSLLNSIYKGIEGSVGVGGQTTPGGAVWVGAFRMTTGEVLVGLMRTDWGY